MLSVPTPFGAIKFRGLFGYLLLGSIPFILLSSLPYAIVSDIALLLWIHGILLWWGNKELIHAGIVRRNLIGRFDLSLIPLAVGITAVMIVFSYGVILLYYYGLVTLWGNTFMELINTPSVSSILGIVAGIVVVPVIEEFFFRGVMLHAMVSRMGFGKGIWITSLLFGFAHFEFISATLFGVVLALVYIRYKSLWLPILIHVLNNAIAFLPSLFVSQSPVIPPKLISKLGGG